MRADRAVASFDSATGMLRALSSCLAGRDAPALGAAPRAAVPVLSALLGGVNRLPAPLADRVYAASGVGEAVPPDRLADIDADDLAEWIVEHYPRRRYPVVFVGSSNGALIHLAAALDAPWLPQTLLIPVRRSGVDRDDPASELEAGRAPGRELLRTNPELVLHHMHDPNQDRLMIAGMSYFRVKWRRLPMAYRRFIREHLAPDGVVVTAECGLDWPVTRVDDRHVFQFGALGGADEQEYFTGGPRVREFLRRYGSEHGCWNPPRPDERRPEAEWGFEPQLLDDLDALGFPLRRLQFSHPEDLSPAVAGLHRSWYAAHELPTDRLLVETFLLLEPHWALRTGSVPFWLTFNAGRSPETLREHLDAVGYEEIRMLLFSHGTESIGLAPIETWQHLVGRARRSGTLLGADPKAYPRDFAGLVRAHRELTRVPTRSAPPTMSFREAESVLRGPNVRL
ncbi:hypothetical protein [Saccharopolyspora mangrovi]|uniref:Uncharacterized protein n=1 Tax=Saccharopolyspora mangrovi TaxID=3082379 RepID=A0ABU6AKY8_9PSEU|nr:hypothetical protein [Saccharopolyspora sp. S2-29]MEB3372175.1 hypothetical protein [Saccharopolyspora sp. S2-29]